MKKTSFKIYFHKITGDNRTTNNNLKNLWKETLALIKLSKIKNKIKNKKVLLQRCWWTVHYHHLNNGIKEEQNSIIHY